MQTAVHPYLRRFARPLAFAMAFFALSFLLQLAPHVHSTNQEAAACGLCQVAHVGVTPAVALHTFYAPFVSFGNVATFSLVFLLELFFHESPSRAPPSLS